MYIYAKVDHFGHLMQRADSFKKTLMPGKRRQEEKGTTGQDGWMVLLLNGHEFEQAPGDNERQGSLEFCSPWDQKESDTTE